MTIEEAYLAFVNKVEQNIINDGMSADRDRFIILFNAAQIKYVEWVLEKRNTDDIKSIQKLLVLDKHLEQGRETRNFVSFTLPKDYLEFVNVDAVASKGKCGNRNMKLWDAKTANIEEILHDEFNKPSFEYEETFYTIASDKVNIYKSDFTLNEARLSYYRYPVKVDMEGYIRADESISSNIDPEFDDRVVNKIITICAKDFSINSREFDKAQMETQNIYTKP